MERTPVPDWAGGPRVQHQHPDKATEPQVKWIKDMLNSKDVDEAAADRLWKSLRIWEDPEELGLTKSKASEIIDYLKKRPRKPGAASPAKWASYPDVPAGRYAVTNTEGELRFYQVWRPKDNPSVFRLYVLHGPDSSEVPFKAQNAIMAKIQADIEGAMRTFGLEIGSCSVCGRRLTNRISRELGIGPVCGGRAWDDFDDKYQSARQAIIDRGEDPDEELTTEGWPLVERM